MGDNGSHGGWGDDSDDDWGGGGESKKATNESTNITTGWMYINAK